MKDLIQAHKKFIKTVKEQMGFSDYGMYWVAFLEGGLTIWLLDRIFFHWLKFLYYFEPSSSNYCEWQSKKSI